MLLRHLRSFTAPVVMCFVLPAFIISLERRSTLRPLFNRQAGLLALGLVIGLAGLALLILTIRMFVSFGRGTIMPWDPTQKLIVTGVYRHVRNPMISGVLLVEVGEALVFASKGVAITAAVFFIVNTVYFIVSEEPGLVKRFGEEYLEYRRHVPMWIPRLKPWRPASNETLVRRRRKK